MALDIAKFRELGLTDDTILKTMQEANYGGLNYDAILKSGVTSAGIVDALQEHFAEPPPQPVETPKEESGDFYRGAKNSFLQVPQLAYGLEAGAGAIGEKLFGEGGIATAIKNQGVAGNATWGEKVKENSKETDSFTTAYDKAKQGDLGALVDWLQYGLGYAGGQGLQLLATGGLGGVVAKSAGIGASKIAGGMVAKESARILSAQAGRKLTESELVSAAEKFGAENLAKVATANVATTIGQTAIVGAQAFGMEGGEIYGDLVSQSVKDGKELSGADLAKAFGWTVAAGGLEFVGDKLGLDVMLGKSKAIGALTKASGAIGLLARGAIAGAGTAAAEGTTEFSQTIAEEYGKGNDPFTESGWKNIWDSAALGVVGGAAMGGVGGSLHTSEDGSTPPAPPIQPTEPPPASGNDALLAQLNARQAATPESIAATVTSAPTLDAAIESSKVIVAGGLLNTTPTATIGEQPINAGTELPQTNTEGIQAATSPEVNGSAASIQNQPAEFPEFTEWLKLRGLSDNDETEAQWFAESKLAKQGDQTNAPQAAEAVPPEAQQQAQPVPADAVAQYDTPVVSKDIPALRAKLNAADQANDLEGIYNAAKELDAAIVPAMQAHMDAGEMPVFKGKNLTYAVHHATDGEHAYQVTRYGDTGALGDTRYKTLDEAVKDSHLSNLDMLTGDTAAAEMDRLAKAEGEYQARKQAVTTPVSQRNQPTVNRDLATTPPSTPQVPLTPRLDPANPLSTPSWTDHPAAKKLQAIYEAVPEKQAGRIERAQDDLRAILDRADMGSDQMQGAINRLRTTITATKALDPIKADIEGVIAEGVNRSLVPNRAQYEATIKAQDALPPAERDQQKLDGAKNALALIAKYSHPDHAAEAVAGVHNIPLATSREDFIRKTLAQGQTPHEISKQGYSLDEIQAVKRSIAEAVVPAQPVAPVAPKNFVNRAAVVFQNRDRSTPALISQMQGIAKAPDYTRVAPGYEATSGAPIVEGELPASAVIGKKSIANTANKKLEVQYAVVEADDLIASHSVDGSPVAGYEQGEPSKLRAIGGNARVAGIKEAYNIGTANEYAAMLRDDSAHGVAPEAIAAMKNPVLVRIMRSEDVTPNIGIELNARTNAAPQVVDQAKDDARSFKIENIELSEDGSPSSSSLKQFVLAMPENERAGLMDRGQPNKNAQDRLNAAIFYQAYGNDELVRIYAESTDEEAKAVISALASAAPSMAKLEGADVDVRDVVTDAAKIAINARRSGKSLLTASQQGDIEYGPTTMWLVKYFAENIRAPRRIGEMLTNLANRAYDESSKQAVDLWGNPTPKKSAEQLLQEQGYEPRATQGNGNQVRPELISGAMRREADEQAGRNEAQAGEEPAQAEGFLRPTTEQGLRQQEAERERIGREEHAQILRDAAARSGEIEAATVNRNVNDVVRDNFALGQSKEEVKRMAQSGVVDMFGAAQPSAESKPADTKFANNKIFTQSAVDAARARLKKKLGNINSGIDTELLQDGMTLAGAHIEAGARSFAAYSKAMIDDLGDAIKPYLRSLYESVRHYPGLETEGMTSSADIDAIAKHQEAAEPKDAAKAKDVGTHFSAGTADFNLGKPRVLPTYFTDKTGKNAKDWYRGWDAANVAAPIAEPESLHSVTNHDTKMQANVFAGTDGKFNVAQKDLDSGDTVPTIKKFDTLAKAIEYADTISPAKAKSGDTFIGKNADGASIFENKEGVRHYFSTGIKIQEAVELVPYRAGNGITGYRPEIGNRKDEYKSAEELGIDKPSTHEAATPATSDKINTPPIINAIVTRLSHEGYKNIGEARAHLSELAGIEIKVGTNEAKRADEALELAAVVLAKKIVSNGTERGHTNQAIYDELVKLYEDKMPNLNVRTSTSVEQQAYSTPVPLAFVASKLAGISSDSVVSEPTAGNGALLIVTDPKRVFANELNAGRATALRSQGYENVSEENGVTWNPPQKVDTVIANPPFGAVKDDNGVSQSFKINERYSTNEIDHAISMNALKAMKDDGTAVLILGGIKSDSESVRSDAYNGKAKRAFYLTLYSEYNVVDHFTVSGSMYAKQGAAWPVDVIVIRGRGKSALSLPAAAVPRIINDYVELGKELQNEQSSKNSQSVGILAGQGEGKPSSSASPGAAVREGGNGGNAPNGGRGEFLLQPGSGAVRADTAGNRENEGLVPVSDLGRADNGLNPERSPPGLTRTTTKEEAETSGQIHYVPTSQANNIGTLVPKNMGTAIKAALAALEKRVGNIDNYVAKQLDYKLSDLSNYFSAEQVDALGLAIDNISNGGGFIIGDQTGVGKGRIVAGLIKYAIKNGKTPIFVTEKPNLYGDMIRDLTDIGMQDVKPFMTNSGEEIPLDQDAMNWLGEKEKVKASGEKTPARYGKFMKTPGNTTALMTGMMGNNSLGAHDAIFTTYSQMQTVKGERTARQNFLDQFSDGAIVIFDESHNAGGTEAGEGRGAKKSINVASGLENQNRSEFARTLAGKAHGVFYSSATYAKRPSVMSLYFRTSMAKAVKDIKQLGAAISAGGVPLQQVVATMLAKAGQYMRRERSFAGVEYNVKEAVVDKAVAENASTIFRAINRFDELKKIGITEMSAQAKKEAKLISVDNSTGGAGVSSTNFTSVLHNNISQLLLTLKAESAVEDAIASLRDGKKVVLTLANTMGSFIEEYVTDNDLKTGDAIDLTYADLLLRYLEKSRLVNKKDAFGGSEKHRLTDEELGSQAADHWNATKDQILGMDFSNIPISPIDYIKNELAKAGFKTGEITGRLHTIDYSGKTPVYRQRPASEKSIAGRMGMVSKFNNGQHDAILINQSGATGLSLHASSKFKDQRQRHMIVIQAEANIDTHMQTLGRVHRTGQVITPTYSQLSADIPAEKRPAAVLAKKMASLNANTTASAKSAFTAEDSLDFMNEYGDQVAAELMLDDPELNEELGDPFKGSASESADDDGVMRKVTGRIPLLTLAKQEEVYQKLEDNYRELLAHHDALGTNKLEAKTLDADAKTKEKTEVFKGDEASDNPFEQSAYAESVDMKKQGRSYTQEQVIDMIKEELTSDSNDIATLQKLGAKAMLETRQKFEADFKEYRREVLDDMDDFKRRDAAGAKLYEQSERVLQFIRSNHVGKTVMVTIDATSIHGVITKIVRREGTKNPAAAGSWKVTIAVADGMRHITLPLTKFTHGFQVNQEGVPHIKALDSGNSASAFKLFDTAQSSSREYRTIITGNILAGFGKFKGGQIVHFTDNEGNMRQGILMSAKFDLEAAMSNGLIKLTPEQATRFMKDGNGGRVIKSEDGIVRIGNISNGDFLLRVPSSKAEGGKYFLNKALIAAAGNDFIKVGQDMRVTLTSSRDLRAVLDALESMNIAMGTDSFRDEANLIAGNKVEPKKGESAKFSRSNDLDEQVYLLQNKYDIPRDEAVQRYYDGDRIDAETGRQYEAMYSKGDEAIRKLTAHNPNSLRGALLDSVTGRKRGAMQAMLDSGMVELISNERAAQIVGEDALYSKPAYSESYEVQPDTARNLPIDGATLVELRRAAAGIESAERGITFTVNADGKAIITGPARVKVPARFQRFANEYELTLVVQRADAKGGFSNSNTAMPLKNREAGALYFGEIGTDHLDRTGLTRFSKDGHAQAFFNPVDGKTYFLHENIDRSIPLSTLAGLIDHEIGVHALKLGKDSKEFKSIMRQVELMRDAGNKKVRDAFDRVPTDTSPNAVTEEAIGYLVQNHPDMPIIKRVIAWFRNALRELGRKMPVMQRAPWNEWVATLTPDDIIYMAQTAMVKAHEAGKRESDYSDRAVISTATNRPFFMSKSADKLYSQLRVAIRDLNDKIFQGSAANVRLHLMNNLGKYKINKDEIFWTGLTEFLSGTNKVSKADVLAFLDENAVQVKDVVLGAGGEELLTANDVEITEDGDEFWEAWVPGQSRTIGKKHYPTKEGARDFALRYFNGHITERNREKNNTKFPTQVLPGGRDYKELLITLPRENATQADIELDKYSHKTGDFVSSHYPDYPNLIAHVRLNTRDDAQGRVGTFAEEFQSDWGIAGSKDGFGTIEEDRAKLADIEKRIEIARQRNLGGGYRVEENTPASTGKTEYWVVVGEGRNTNYSAGKFSVKEVAEAKVRELEKESPENSGLYAERDRLQNRLAKRSFVPPAPFVTSATGKGSTAHTLLSLKKTILYAIEQGHEFVSWTTGAQQKDRYSLSKQVDEINVYKNTDGSYTIQTFKDMKELTHAANIQESELADYIGKDLAKKAISESVAGKAKNYEGLDLDIGGEWADTLYGDENGLDANGKPSLMSQAVKEVARQLGIELKVESILLDGYDEKVVFNKDTGKDVHQELMQPGFTITPELRSKVTSAGMPLFSKQQPIENLRTEQPERNTAVPPKETTAQGFQRVAQDKMNRFAVIRDWITEQGINLTEAADVWMHEGNMHGKVAARLEDFRTKTVEPLVKRTQQAGFTMGQVAEYLEMQHIPEANARMREIHNDPDATANGVTDAAAKAVVVQYQAMPNFAALDAVAKDWRAISDTSRQILLDAGIITPEMANAWQATYQNYVPLKGDETQTGTGKGLNVNGKTKRRLGHGDREEAVIQNMLRDHERAIMLAEKNTVGIALIHMAMEAQNDELITVGQPVKRQVFKDKVSFAVAYQGNTVASFETMKEAQDFIRLDTVLSKRQPSNYGIARSNDPSVIYMASPMLADNEVQVYINGHAVRVQLNDELLARAYTNMGVEHVGMLLSAAREFNSWLSKAYTGYNPEFALVNMVRDLFAGTINLTGDYGIGMTAKIYANYPKAFKELLRSFSDPVKSQIVSDYRKAGGNTGAAYLSDIERIGKDVMNSYNEYAGAIDTYSRIYQEAIDSGHSKMYAATKAAGKAVSAKYKHIPLIGHFLTLMEHVNAVTENALRVATYMTLKQHGYSDAKSAQAAKMSTVNFNRKGEMTATAGALYLFFNPNIQGTERIISVLGSSKHKNQARALTGMMALGAFALAEMMRGGDDEDKWKRIPGYIKDRNIVFMFGDTQFMLPMPYGYGLFHTLGNVMSDVVHGENGWKAGVRLGDAIFGNFSPIGNPIPDGNLKPLQLLPTSIKMAIAPESNENNFGRPIQPIQYNDTKPDSTNMYRTTKGTLYAQTAEGMNALTGGNSYRKGAVDVSPETIKFWVQSLTGGAGKFLFDTADLASMGAQGVEPDMRELPIVRKFVREPSISDTRSMYWDAAKEAKQAAAEFHAAIKSRDVAGAKQLLEENKPLIAMAKYAEHYEKAIKAKRDAVDAVKADDKLTLAEKRLRMKELELQEATMYNKFLDAFEEKTKH